MGVPEHTVEFRRYLAATTEGLHEALCNSIGEDYAQALIEGDPEVDMEQVGQHIGRTDKVFLASDGSVLFSPPKVMELLFGTDGEERERRIPEDIPANVNDESPIRWTGKKMPILDVVRRFVLKRSLQLKHVDGLTFDYLYAIAKELADEECMVLLGGGTKGKDPLVFHMNGTPYRAFLEGRIDGERYILLLHLSNMELKRSA